MNTPQPSEEAKRWENEGARLLTMNWQRFFPDDAQLATRLESAYQKIIADPELQRCWIDMFARAQSIDTQSDGTTEWSLEQHGNIYGFLQVINGSIKDYLSILDGKGEQLSAITLEKFLDNPNHPYHHFLIRALRKFLHYGAMKQAVHSIEQERERDFLDNDKVWKLYEANQFGLIPLKDLLPLVPAVDAKGEPNTVLREVIESKAKDGMVEYDHITEFLTGRMNTALTIGEVNDRIETLYADQLNLFGYAHFREDQRIKALQNDIRTLVMQFGNAVQTSEINKIAGELADMTTGKEAREALMQVVFDIAKSATRADLELLFRLLPRLGLGGM